MYKASEQSVRARQCTMDRKWTSRKSSILGNATSEVTFTINGKKHTVNGDVPLSTLLNTYIRDYANLKGTKVMCREGVCGCCVVTARIKDVGTGQEGTYAVNSCLVRVYACHGWAIETIEGIGNKKTGYNKAQARLACWNGTQCGFCSPGMVMNFYGLKQNGDVTMEEVEDSFGGNLCRCTGYRPILDAFKSLCIDASPYLSKKVQDIEELYKLKICPKSGRTCSGKCSDDEDSDANSSEDDFVHVNVDGTFIRTPSIVINEESVQWVKATKMSEIFEYFDKNIDVPYALAGANTSHVLYRSTEEPKLYIDVQDIPELISYSTESTLTFGANMSLTAVKNLFNTVSKKQSNYAYTQVLAQHIDLIANVPVRNVGTIAGNLSTKYQHRAFRSDIFVILETVGATLTIASKDKTESNVSLASYLDMDMCYKVIQNITLPPLDDSYYLKTYKITPRAQNAFAHVNAGFLVQLKKTGKGRILSRPRIVYGGINPNFARALNTEDFLEGRYLFDSHDLQAALRILETEINPDQELLNASRKFRKTLALALFYKFVLSLSPPELSPRFASGGKELIRPLSSGRQEFKNYRADWPLREPIPKLEAIAQCSGEAQFINDLPAIPGEAFAAFVLTTVGQGCILNINALEALKMPGVLKFLSAEDIPGANNFTPLEFVYFVEPEEIFCSGNVKYYGQPLGLIVAESYELAVSAVSKVIVHYKDVKKPLLNIREVILSGDKSRIRVQKEADSIKVHGQNEVTHVINGTFEHGGQYHFTMETQQCVCIPTEDGLDVYASTQWMDVVQVAISQVLNIQENSINMRVKRVGGAYGSKISRNTLISTACALAATVLDRPVRLIMSLESNMEAIGKRNDVLINYAVGTDDDGKVQYLNADFYENSGSSWNEEVVPYSIHFMSSCYDTSTWKIRGLGVRTDIPSATWCRAPGSTEGTGTIEHIMEHIAKVVKKDPIQVRLNNMSSEDNAVPQMIEDLKCSADYDRRKQRVDEFNKNHRWTKKGIALVPLKYGIEYSGNFYALVSIYAVDGTVAVAHGGIEVGQGINTKVAQAVAHTLNINLECVKIKASNNLTAPNNSTTGYSITSEVCAYAAVQCCKELLKRMQPAKKQLKNQTWKQWVQEAYKENIDLCATYMYPSSDYMKSYNIFGVTICEVELDLLTGRYQIMRVDIVEDAGESLNPDIDIGQVEGAFVMGLGYWLTEYLVYCPGTGKLLTDNAFTYKPLGAKDIPIDFRIKLKRNPVKPLGVLCSKATGEPPLCMTCSVVFALRYALESARKEAGLPDEWFQLDLPATVENVFLASDTNMELFTL